MANNMTAQDRTKAILYNPAGIPPVGEIVRFTSSDIEEFILDTFRTKYREFGGGDFDDLDFGMKIIWNSEFNRVMQRHEKDSKVVPFTVIVGYSPRDKKNRNNKGGNVRFNVGSQQSRVQLTDLLYNESEKTQFDLSENEALNRCVSIFTRNGKIKWHKSKKKDIVQLVLDSRVIIEVMFGCHSEQCKNFEWETYWIDAAGPNTMKDRRSKNRFKPNGYWTDQFTVLVGKMIKDQKYKNLKKKKDIKKYL